MNEQEAQDRLERRSRRRWTLFIVSFFVLQAILWTFALNLVSNDASHAVVEDYDRLALNWDEQRAKIDASAALGWSADVQVEASASDGPGSIRVALTDRDRHAVQADRVVATLFHQAKAANKQTIELMATAPGIYVGPASIERPGKWRVRIDASAGRDAYFDTQTRTVPAGAVPVIALLSSVFAAAVLGSLHCVGMCGPFAALATARRDRVRLPQVSAASCSSAYNGGRLAAYLVLGGAAGGIGLFVDASGTLVGVSRLATGLAGGTMVLVGLAGLLSAAGVRIPLSGGAAMLPVLARLSAVVAELPPHRRAAALGGLTSLMPCGWLWAFVLTAAGTGSPLAGAAVMLAFWAGTVPAMGLLGAGIHTLSGRMRRHLPWLMPALVTAVGAYTLMIRAPLPLAATATADSSAQQETAPEPDPGPSVPAQQDAPCH